jgi:hypothetical protein
MNWDKKYELNPNINYFSCHQLHQSDARNVFLQMLYDSDDDYALFMDDDTIPKIVKDYSIEEMFDKCVDLVEFDVLSARSDFAMPKDVVRLRLTKHVCGNFFFFKNLKKFYGKEEYFDPTYKVLEDQEMGVRMTSKRYKIYDTQHILTSDALNSSVLMSQQENKTRREANSEATQRINETYEKILGYSIKTSTHHNNILKKECGYKNIVVPIEEF